jgi:hypothetical protein
VLEIISQGSNAISVVSKWDVVQWRTPFPNFGSCDENRTQDIEIITSQVVRPMIVRTAEINQSYKY